MNSRHSLIALSIALATAPLAAQAHEKGGIHATRGNTAVDSFDIVHADVTADGGDLVFRQRLAGQAGSVQPQPAGQLAGAPVASYVWPTNLDPGSVGFEAGTGILALAVTSHPDFDDTPLYDETGDGDYGNDGLNWHSHWVVLTKSDACAGGLKVRDIPDGETPKLPATWPNLPIFIDSPSYRPAMKAKEVTVRLPLADLGLPQDLRFDAVTAGLQVNQNVHAPLLCVTDVRDIASGDLSLPGQLR